jgi:hypothetical protein
VQPHFIRLALLRQALKLFGDVQELFSHRRDATGRGGAHRKEKAPPQLTGLVSAARLVGPSATASIRSHVCVMRGRCSPKSLGEALDYVCTIANIETKKNPAGEAGAKWRICLANGASMRPAPRAVNHNASKISTAANLSGEITPK